MGDKTHDVIAQDAGIIARSDGYGPVGKGGQQIKARPAPPAPIVKASAQKPTKSD